MPAYAGLLDFGIGAGLVKHFTEYSKYGDLSEYGGLVTEYSQYKDLNGVRQVMTLSLSVYVLLGIVLTPIIYLLAPDVMALMPSATMIQVDKTRKEDVEKFYREMSRYLMLITLMITGFTAITADRLIITWIGRPYPQATFIVIALGFSFAINNLTGGGTNIVQAAGQPRYETYYAVVSMLLNIGLTVALAPTFGLAGILAGTIIGSSIGSIYFIVLFHRRFGFSWFQTMGNWLFRLVATTVLACLGLHFLQAWVSAGWSASRWAGLILLSMYGIAYLICFAIGGILFGFWSDNDIEVSRRLMLKIAHSRRR